MTKAIFSSVLSAVVTGATLFGAAPATAQSADISPVLLIETGPSANPDYRRVIFVKYLSGNTVDVNYRAYTRTEFAQVPDQTSTDVISNCSNGAATPLSDILAFQKTEARRAKQKQLPETAVFCVKNVPNWEGGGRDHYLDPIFDGLPYAAVLNN